MANTGGRAFNTCRYTKARPRLICRRQPGSVGADPTTPAIAQLQVADMGTGLGLPASSIAT